MDDSASAAGYLGPSPGTRANQYNRRLEWLVSPQDVSRHFVASFAYELQFGKGKRFLGSAPRGANLFIAGRFVHRDAAREQHRTERRAEQSGDCEVVQYLGVRAAGAVHLRQPEPHVARRPQSGAGQCRPVPLQEQLLRQREPVQFGSPDTNIQSGSFGVISGTAQSPRPVQLALKFYF